MYTIYQYNIPIFPRMVDVGQAAGCKNNYRIFMTTR
jgi:hypothetical protein